MAKSPGLSDTQKVTEHIRKIDAPFAEIIETIRQVILGADKSIGEKIKWNSPSFYYTGEMKPFDPKEYKRDIVVVNLHLGSILLVFPTGAKIRDNAGVLEGIYTDGRRIVKIADMADLKSKEKSLKKVIKEWIGMVE